MIRRIEKEEIPKCVELIRKSFMTVAQEFGFTIQNAPRFTAFAISDERLIWQYENGYKMFTYEDEQGELIGYYSLTMKENRECELNNLCVQPESRHLKIGKELLDHAYKTAIVEDCVKMNIDIVEENVKLRKWYEENGAIHLNTKKFDFFPFTCGYMEKRFL